MNRRTILGLVTVLVLSIPAAAHEGHVHKVMGTITARQDDRLEVRTRDGKTVSITLNEKTSVLRGRAKADVDALKPGERVVVDVGNGKAPLTAREIKLGAAVAARK